MIRWILTCNMECKDKKFAYVAMKDCPQRCPYSAYEKEQLNTEVEDNG